MVVFDAEVYFYKRSLQHRPCMGRFDIFSISVIERKWKDGMRMYDFLEFLLCQCVRDWPGKRRFVCC